jgi:hypothetical protein
MTPPPTLASIAPNSRNSTTPPVLLPLEKSKPLAQQIHRRAIFPPLQANDRDMTRILTSSCIVTSTAAAIQVVTCGGCVAGVGGGMGQPPVDHVYVRTTGSQAAAAARIGAGLAGRKLGELTERLRSCFRRVEPFLQARKYVRGS